MIDRVASLPFSPEPATIELVYAPLAPDNELQLNVLAHESYPARGAPRKDETPTSEPQRFALGAFGHSARFFNLLKVNNLGEDSLDRWNVPSSVNVYVPLETLRRMRAVLE